MREKYRFLVVLGVLAVAGGTAAASGKDESRLAPYDNAATAENQAPLPLPPAAAGTEQSAGDGAVTDTQDPTDHGEDLSTPDSSQPDVGASDGQSEDNLNLGEIPDIKTVELTVDGAKRALDAYLMVRDKYKDADLEAYDDLQDFVDKNEQGKAFEADIKAAGFATVQDWDIAIKTLSLAYTGIIDDPTGDIKMQIDEIQSDTTIAQDMKDKWVASLNAMIPSENNKTVANTLMKDPAYLEKLKALDTAEGE